MTQIQSPWTQEQVDALNRWQQGQWVHPFTCLNRGDGKHRHIFNDLGTLIATENGWMCPCCDYTQNWAHDFMFDEPPNAIIF